MNKARSSKHTGHDSSDIVYNLVESRLMNNLHVVDNLVESRPVEQSTCSYNDNNVKSRPDEQSTCS